MTDIKLALKDIVLILIKVSADMKMHIDELRELDAVIGDGDLGVTFGLAAEAIASYLAALDETDTGKMLAKCGMNINRTNPSTFGTLLASAFLGAGKAVQNKPEITANDLILMGNGAIDGIKKRGKAEIGDKTILDSLVPSVEAFQRNFAEKGDIAEAMKSAVLAAEAGMQTTANMRARVGRGSYRQDGTMGIRDGGATAMYFLIESFARHLNATLSTN
ncbi:MAG: dihydroxyacetone kinase subunit L [Dehalococcoidales bacterium]|nr:dihydroxyacetone kinase subunit L [Dehalococcoidales bacterium]